MRNSLLLNRPSQYLDQIKAIDWEMAKYSFAIIKRRELFVEELAGLFSKTFQQLFSEDHQIKIKLQSKWISQNVQQIYNFVQSNVSKDINAKRTTEGVHLDDYMLLFDGFNALEICSLGQQKMAFLGLLFAYIELFKYKLRTYPIILIDDISGELDRKKMEQFS